MIDETIIALGRICIFTILTGTLTFSANCNKGPTNIPLYCGYGLVFLYVCYVFSGITFGNGISLGAEFLFAILIAILAIGFTIGNDFSKKRIVFANNLGIPANPILIKLPVSNKFIFATGIIFVLYINILTNWNPLVLISQSTELKHYRLNLILVEKDFFLFFLESAVISALIVGLIWSIICHKDDKSSDRALSFFLVLILLQIISTGARSPLIGIFLLFFLALYEGRKSSSRVKLIFISIKRYKLYIIAFMTIYMILTTASRIKYEGLAASVFKSYFDIIDFGLSVVFFQSDSGILFLLGTIVVYAADTFNNFVLRFQLASTIDHSLGYQFLFPYVSFLEPLTKSFTNIMSTWRQISSHNNEILTNVADSATQWPTLFGDFIWDFGVMGAVIIVFLSSIFLGYIIGLSRRRPSVANTILKIYLVGSFLLPLVSPFSSLQFHIVCIFLFGFNWLFASKRKHIKTGTNY